MESSCHVNCKTHLLKFSFLFAILLSGSFNLVVQTYAWSNGDYSDDPSKPNYGTHDWIAEHALDWLPADEKEYIISNLAIYLYGTELPDKPKSQGGIGDASPKHHIYFSSKGILTDDSAAARAQEEYDKALSYLKMKNLAIATETAGIISHYISDMAVFGHVMGSATDWGAETHHSKYEEYVNIRTNEYEDDFNVYLSFDGSLDNISAYDAAVRLAYDTTFDTHGNFTCTWMDKNYNWSQTSFRDRCGRSLNLAVNLLTDILHTLYVSSYQQLPTEKKSTEISCSISSSEITEGSTIAVSGAINPALSDKTITLTYRKPDGSTQKRTVVTSSDGNYHDSYTPDATGLWSVTASWNGDPSYNGASSPSRTFTVKQKPFTETPTGAAAIVGGLITIIAVVAFVILRRRA